MIQPLGMLRFKDISGNEVAVEVTRIVLIEERKQFGGSEPAIRVWTDRNEYRETRTSVAALVEEYEHILHGAPSELTAGDEPAAARRSRADQSATLGSF